MEPEFFDGLVYQLKMIVGSNNFSAQFIKIISHYKNLCIAADCMLGGQPNHSRQLCFPLKLHTDGSDFRLYNGSDLKTYLLMRWQGPDALAVVRPTGGYLLDFLAPVFSFIYCGVLIFALSPFYILIYMF